MAIEVKIFLVSSVPLSLKVTAAFDFSHCSIIFQRFALKITNNEGKEFINVTNNRADLEELIFFLSLFFKLFPGTSDLSTFSRQRQINCDIASPHHFGTL